MWYKRLLQPNYLQVCSQGGLRVSIGIFEIIGNGFADKSLAIRTRIVVKVVSMHLRAPSAVPVTGTAIPKKNALGPALLVRRILLRRTVRTVGVASNVLAANVLLVTSNVGRLWAG